MKILINGAGIAGLTAAYWLHHYGHEVHLVEKHATFRERYGYMIDFFGPGYEVADKMNLIPQLTAKHYEVPKLLYINPKGNVSSAMNITRLRKAMQYREFTFLRGDLEDVLYQAIGHNVQLDSGITIDTIEQQDNTVAVSLSNGNHATYDMVIGADGIHSQVRKQIFGPETNYSRYLGYHVAAFIQPNSKNIKNFLAYSRPEKQMAIFPLRDNQLATYFIYKNSQATLPHPKKAINDAFHNAGWITPDILQSLNDASEMYADPVSQIVMPTWHHGRVALVGDACQCLTLISGQGASMAMAGGYLLAQCLHQANNNHAVALQQYQQQLMPLIQNKQQQAIKFMRQFIPNTQIGIHARNIASWSLNLPFLARLFLRPYQISKKQQPSFLQGG